MLTALRFERAAINKIKRTATLNSLDVTENNNNNKLVGSYLSCGYKHVLSEKAYSSMKFVV